MKTNLKFLILFFLSASFAARAQVAPEATGGLVTPAAGDRLQYALRYAETGQFSSSLSNWQTSTTSGSLTYGNKDERLPFLVDYTGGYTWTLTGPSFDSGQFHRLFISQGINSHKWKLLLSDDFSYLPQSPTIGFSGLPGFGDPIGGTNPAPPSNSQSILTVNTHALYDTALGKVEHSFSGATALTLIGGWSLLRYPSNDGQNTNTLLGTARLAHRLNARNTLTTDYQFNQFTYPGLVLANYPGQSLSFVTNSALVGYQREWTRNLITNIALGPQFINSSITSLAPNSTNIAADASVDYKLRFATANLRYSRSVNGGAGYLVGGEYSSVSGGLSKNFGMNFNLGMSGGWEQTSTLSTGGSNSGSTDATFGGVQATYHLGRNLIFFGNYTGTNQTTSPSLSSVLPSNVLNQVLQIVGFGVGFSPRETHRNQ
jgi:hypothetical protein